MTWPTHAVLGMGAGLVVAALAGAPPGWVGPVTGLAGFAALLPDLDAAGAKASTLSLWGVRPLAPLSLMLHRALGHRGWLHSPLALLPLAAICGASVPLTGALAPAALWAGYASHLAADACTRSGLPLVPGRPVRLHLLPKGLRLVTGSQAEEVLMAAAGCLVLAGLLRTGLFALSASLMRQ